MCFVWFVNQVQFTSPVWSLYWTRSVFCLKGGSLFKYNTDLQVKNITLKNIPIISEIYFVDYLVTLSAWVCKVYREKTN